MSTFTRSAKCPGAGSRIGNGPGRPVGAAECARVWTWMFFSQLEAAVFFAPVAQQTDVLGTVDIHHAYTEAIFSPGGLGPTRRFLGGAGSASRSLFDDRVVQSCVEQQVLQ